MPTLSHHSVPNIYEVFETEDWSEVKQFDRGKYLIRLKGEVLGDGWEI